MKNISIVVVIVIVSVMMLTGCNNSTSPPYDGISSPRADFTAFPTSGGLPLTVEFSDLSTGNVTEWAWDFNNDGVVDSNENDPSYVYQNAGKYTVSLKVTGPGGSNTEIKNEYIRVQDFELTEWKLLGESGYAVFYVKFNTLGGVTLRFMNPVGTLVDVEYIEKDVVGAAAKLKMDNQWENPKAGQYTLVVQDALGEDIFEKTFDFNGSDVTMSDLAISWHLLFGEFLADELFFKIVNNGDLPACIYNCEVSIDGKGKTLSTEYIILPGEQKTKVKSTSALVSDYLFKVKGSGEKTVECTLRDKADTVIATYSGKVTVG